MSEQIVRYDMTTDEQVPVCQKDWDDQEQLVKRLSLHRTILRRMELMSARQLGSLLDAARIWDQENGYTPRPL